MSHQLWPEIASFRFRQGHLKQRTYFAPTPRDDMNRPHRNWHANRPAKTPGPCPGDRSRVPHARSDVRPALIIVLAPHAPTWPALYIPRLDCSFAGRREEKTFTIHGESASASEDRRYIAMDKSMHVSRAAYLPAFEHIPNSVRSPAITHVARARLHTTPLACARGELQYVSDIEVKKEQAASTRTLVSCQTWRGVVFIGLRTRFVQRGVVLAVFPVP